MSLAKQGSVIFILLCCLLLSLIKSAECKKDKSQLCLTRRWRICKHKVEPSPKLNDVNAILIVHETSIDPDHKDEVVSSKTREEDIQSAKIKKHSNNAGESLY